MNAMSHTGNTNDQTNNMKPSSAGHWDVDMDVMRPGMWKKGRGRQKVFFLFFVLVSTTIGSSPFDLEGFF